MKRIALLGEFDPTLETQVATVRAIEHSARFLGLDVLADWVSTTDVGEGLFRRYGAIWIAPGGRYKNQDNLFRTVRFARERGIPCFGTCGGFQHMILEYARHELDLPDAQSVEYDSHSSQIVISELACSLRGREMPLTLQPGSLVARLYESSEAVENYYCSFGVNPAFVDQLRSGRMKITGTDPEGEFRVIEWPQHRFFLGTLFVPQTKSSAEHPHPLVSGFLNAV